MRINSYDIDGVIKMSQESDVKGLKPEENDVIITGRSFEEASSTLRYLHRNEIYNQVFFNPKSFTEKTRESSGIHKGNMLVALYNDGMEITFHFEDDLIQIEKINEILKENNISSIFVIHVNSNGLVELENKRHYDE